MEQARQWSLLDEFEEDAPITEEAAQRVRTHASAGCLICAFEEAEGEWDDE
jgi:hypothetical protein